MLLVCYLVRSLETERERETYSQDRDKEIFVQTRCEKNFNRYLKINSTFDVY